MIDLKALAEGAGILAIAKETSKRIVAPVADEAGKALGTFGEIVRFYQDDNLGKIFKKWWAQRGTAIPEEKFRDIIPLLQLASVQSDEELQGRWAALLETTVSNVGGTLPSFGQTLSQMNTDEARFLERLLKASSEKFQGVYYHLRRPGQMSFAELVKVYDPSITVAVEPLTVTFVNDFQLPPEVLSRAQLVFDDLLRMGILTLTQDAQTFGDGYGDTPGALETVLMGWYSMSSYGLAFLHAVTQSIDSDTQI